MHRRPVARAAEHLPLARLLPGLALAVSGPALFFRLGSPPSFVFDEAYYVPDATDLLRGHLEPAGVQPPLGKWLIAEAIRLGGLHPAVWRTPSAVAGALTIGLAVAVAARLTTDVFLRALPLLMLADRAFFTAGRAAFLDMPLSLAVLGSFWLGLRAAEEQARDARRAGWAAAYVLAGAAVAIKWSGAVAVLAVALLQLYSLIRSDSSEPHRRIALRVGRVILAGLAIVAISYALFWTAWVLAASSGDPNACQTGRCAGGVSALAEVVEDQRNVLDAQLALKPRNRYAASATSWLTGGSGTLLFQVRCGTHAVPGCRGSRSTERIVSATNPALWFSGILACGLLVLGLIRRQRAFEGRHLVIAVVPIAAMLPWLVLGRAVYAFNSVVATPFIVLAVIAALAVVPRGRRLIASVIAVAAVVDALIHLSSFGVY